MATDQKTIGYVAAVPKGEYVSGTTYEPLNIVRYNNAVYMAVQTTSAAPTAQTDANWMLLNKDVLEGNTIVTVDSLPSTLAPNTIYFVY